MSFPTIGNRSLLQPASLVPQQLQGAPEGVQQANHKSVVGLESQHGPRSIGLGTPVRVTGTVNGAGHARSLSELTLDAATPQQIGARRDQTVGLVNKLINAIESDRAKNGGELGKQGQALRECVNRFGAALALLSDGSAAGDRLTAQMESLQAMTSSLKAEMEGDPGTLPEGAHAQVKTLCEGLLAQVQDRVSYLGHTVANAPLSLHRMYESKAQFSDAAVRVINAQLVRSDLSSAQRGKLEEARNHIFAARAGQLRQEASEQFGKLGNAKEVLGKKPSKFLSMLGIGAQQRARDNLGREFMNAAKGGSLPRCNTPEIDEQTLIHDTLETVFKEAGVVNPDLDHAFHGAMNQVLNDGQDWKPVLNEIQLQSGSETLLSYSEINPAGNLLGTYAGKGINSHSTTEYTHAVNLAQTQLRDGQGEVLFSGLRHGVICAYGINASAVRHMGDEELAPMVQTLLPKEMWTREGSAAPSLEKTVAAVRKDARLVDAMRHEANNNRAREIVLASVLSDGALMQRALAGETVPLDILSISLLTPDNVRPLLQGASSNERQMLQEQMQAWDNAKGLKTFTVADAEGNMREITVDVRPVACNYGVNAGGVGAGSWAVGGWDNVAGINAQALDQLLGTDIKAMANAGMPGGLIGERMRTLERQVFENRQLLEQFERLGAHTQADQLRAQLRVDEPRLAQAREITQQIAQIHQEGSYRAAGQEPYKMPTRLAVLAELFGVKVMFNCKSGKDRTGELDAEIKHFKLQTGLTGKVPHYERTRSAEEIAQFHQVVTHSGNFEMQRLNTGYAGYKLKGVDALYQQFGGQKKGDDVTANFLGLSSFTAS
ncbi:MAG: inositol phosphate phosphatase SopB [Comamonas sp.]